MDRYAASTLTALATEIIAAAAVPRADAEILADSLVWADLSNTSTHGLSRLAIYLKRIANGLINPTPDLIVERQRGATMTIDADNGLGQVQATKALDRLIPMARDNGVAVATINNSQHFGALSYYTNRCAAENQILLAMTNCEPAMSPHGGADPFFGTNPIAVSFPTGKDFTVKIDLSTSVIARGNVIAAQKRNQPIPPGWALDPDGNPTTDASAALMGTVLTMAGHKGYALAVMVECLSSVLSGAAIGPDIGSMYKDLDRPQNVGHFFCLLDIEAFMDVELFKQRIDDMIDRIKSSKKRPGVEEILLPGERSARAIRENLHHGILLDPSTVKELQALCQEFRIDFDLTGKTAA